MRGQAAYNDIYLGCRERAGTGVDLHEEFAAAG